MKKIINLICVIFLLSITSCSELESSQSENNLTNQSVSIKDGRLYFPTKEIFKEYMKKYIDASENELTDFFNPLYVKGFYSLRPIVTEQNEQLVYNHYMKLISVPKMNSLKSGGDYFDYLDEIEDIIGDDVFAAFLNDKAEIQIEDIVYKYTDVGLFYTKENKLDELKSFLEVRNVSDDMKIETSDAAKTAMINAYPNDGITPINSNLTYYKEMYLDPNSVVSEDSSGGGSYNPTPHSPASADPSYYSFLNNLQSCEPDHGLFGNLFGDNNVCIDKYENRRRVKTKAFNYNYLVVYHMGVKVHHQFRGNSLLWRTEAASEIRLVVEAAQFEYDLDALLGNNAITNQTRERAYFMNNQKAFFSGPNTITFNNQWGTPLITYQNLNSLPTIFQDDLTIEFFSTGWDWLDGQVQNGIDSNTKASKFNEWFYDGLYSTASSQLQTAFGSSTTPKPNRTFVAKFPQNGKMLIQKSVLDIGYGNGIAQRTFDWGAEFSLSSSPSGNNSWNISGGAGNQLVRPANFRVKIIGAARGDSWHGSKFNVGID